MLTPGGDAIGGAQFAALPRQALVPDAEAPPCCHAGCDVGFEGPGSRLDRHVALRAT
ncbi:hypothetical protein LOK46_31630 (plasmid) [Methylobacterium sp. NMS14P]|uniref:hypothetical protein n=1 Tax=Methylobacterium sp. NMS14P TaxID=2894310 RepID=UPI002359FD6E|nr:hypothetical protein [Methylobacterium sp. NMS14P]WCS28470.1 hypothetical protein LOK46_31630 [Methylobacterium sp. NMS14P]